jgi:hypothetical protein
MRAPSSVILESSFSWRRSIPGHAEDCPGFPFRRHYGKDHAFFVATPSNFLFGRLLEMLKKKIFVIAIAVCLSIPSISQASPLSWIPGPGVLVKLAQLWDRLPGVHPARPARSHQKQGCGMDPNGSPLCGPGPTQATAPVDPVETGR